MTPAQKLKDKFRSRTLTLGTWVSLGNSSIAEVMVQAGYDWVTIDNEHSMLNPKDIQTLITTIQGAGACALVRLSENQGIEIRKIMDAGADGVICPMINNANDAKLLIDAVKYPPLGKRSYGLYRAQGYGSHPIPYFESINERSIVIALIEQIEGVRNLESILDVPGLDGVIIGPYDLSGSLGLPGQLNHPKVLAAEETVLSICKKRGISCGAHLVHPEPAIIEAKFKMGYTFFALGTDFIFISEAAKQTLEFAQKAFT